jgi:hypothetical protein
MAATVSERSSLVERAGRNFTAATGMRSPTSDAPPNAATTSPSHRPAHAPGRHCSTLGCSGSEGRTARRRRSSARLAARPRVPCPTRSLRRHGRHRCNRWLARGDVTPAAAARAVRADLLDTYDARLHATLQSARAAARRGSTSASQRRLRWPRGYVRILADSYRSQRGVATYARLETPWGA